MCTRKFSCGEAAAVVPLGRLDCRLPVAGPFAASSAAGAAGAATGRRLAFTLFPGLNRSLRRNCFHHDSPHLSAGLWKLQAAASGRLSVAGPQSPAIS